MESNNEDDEIPESISRQEPITFPLHILKNLTPLDAQVKIPYKSKYKQVIDLKKTHLRNKNILVDRKSLLAKLHQELIAAQRYRQLLKRLEVAKINRNKILQETKLRASASMKRFLAYNTAALPPSTETTKKSPLNLEKYYFTNAACLESSIARIKNSGFLKKWKNLTLANLKLIMT